MQGGVLIPLKGSADANASEIMFDRYYCIQHVVIQEHSSTLDKMFRHCCLSRLSLAIMQRNDTLCVCVLYVIMYVTDANVRFCDGPGMLTMHLNYLV